MYFNEMVNNAVTFKCKQIVTCNKRHPPTRNNIKLHVHQPRLRQYDVITFLLEVLLIITRTI